MSTMRRDALRRLVEAGKVELVASYHFDDALGTSGHADGAIPCAMIPEDRHTCREGVCYLFPSDFTSGSGSAQRGPDGAVSLYVHSNSNYKLRIKP